MGIDLGPTYRVPPGAPAEGGRTRPVNMPRKRFSIAARVGRITYAERAYRVAYAERILREAPYAERVLAYAERTFRAAAYLRAPSERKI